MKNRIRARLQQIKAEATAILDNADATNAGAFAADQAMAFDMLMAEKANLEANLKRVEQLDAMDVGTGRVSAPVAPSAPLATVKPRFEEDPMVGFKGMADYALSVQAACRSRGASAEDERLQFLAAPSSNVAKEFGTSDGYLVPPAIVSRLEESLYSEEGLLSKVDPEPTSGNQVQINADETTPWGTTGVQAYWGTEAGALTASKPAVAPRFVQLGKLYAFVEATEELLADAPMLESRLSKKSGEAILWKADEALVNGDGVGKPLGWMSASCLVSQAAESAQTATTVVANNVLKMRSRLLGGGAGAFWLVHSSVIPQLGAMTIGDQPVWLTQGNVVTANTLGTLLGLPIYESEHCQTLGTAGDIQLIQPRGYVAAIKQGGVKFATSMHLWFNYDTSAFRWTFRLAGQPLLSAAVSPAKGSVTKSHFIVCATRS